MGTLQENQSLNAEYERNKKEREMKEEIERLKLELSGYRQAILQDKEMLGLKQENERLHSIIKEVRECVETAISEDYYDGEIYKINEIIDKINKD